MEVKSDYWLDTEENEKGETSFALSADVRIILFYSLFNLDFEIKHEILFFSKNVYSIYKKV